MGLPAMGNRGNGWWVCGRIRLPMPAMGTMIFISSLSVTLSPPKRVPLSGLPFRPRRCLIPASVPEAPGTRVPTPPGQPLL